MFKYTSLMSFTVTSEHSVKDADGRIRFFSGDHFLRDIVEGDCCFICGVSPGTVEFTLSNVARAERLCLRMPG